MQAVLLIFLGGGLGSVLRYTISKALNPERGFYWGTFTVNIVGCLIIGLIMGWALKQEDVPHDTIFLAAVGFCGGFTTFSSFALEGQQLLKAGDYTTLLLYSLLSIMVGILAVFAGLWLSKIAISS